MNIDSMRREYLRTGLQRESLHDDPIVQFNTWLEQVVAMGINDPTAMTVATVSADGQPSQRIVLLKQVDAAGFVFFTNFDSRKGQEIKANPQVSLHFPWHQLERQVKVCGTAEPTSTAETLKYFLTRPKESQLAAWASAQSRPLSSRQVLMQQFASIKAKFKKGQVPLPDFWGGFRIKPHEIEFWQGGEYRLHDRFQYSLQAEGQWNIERLAP